MSSFPHPSFINSLKLDVIELLTLVKPACPDSIDGSEDSFSSLSSSEDGYRNTLYE